MRRTNHASDRKIEQPTTPSRPGPSCFFHSVDRAASLLRHWVLVLFRVIFSFGYVFLYISSWLTRVVLQAFGNSLLASFFPYFQDNTIKSTARMNAGQRPQQRACPIIARFLCRLHLGSEGPNLTVPYRYFSN